MNWEAEDLKPGAVIPQGGTARRYKTGSWCSQQLHWREDECTHCLICWIFCPDSSIQVQDSKMIGIDLNYCKGCGICAQVCPKKAIEMTKGEKGV